MINGVGIIVDILTIQGGVVIGLEAKCDCCNAEIGGAVDSILLVVYAVVIGVRCNWFNVSGGAGCGADVGVGIINRGET